MGRDTWHRDIFDAKLRRQPDLVADLFTDRVAERFCDLDDWNQDLFRPLRPGSGERAIRRYLELREADRLVVDDSIAERFAAILDREDPVFVLGPSGSGKTITSLHLADTFEGGAWRVFFVSLRHDIDEDRLVSTRRSSSAPPRGGSSFHRNSSHGFTRRPHGTSSSSTSGSRAWTNRGP